MRSLVIFIFLYACESWTLKAGIGGPCLWCVWGGEEVHQIKCQIFLGKLEIILKDTDIT